MRVRGMKASDATPLAAALCGIFAALWYQPPEPLRDPPPGGGVATTIATASGPIQPQQGCPPSLQSLVTAAAAGATVNVPACVYREMIVITKPLVLVGQRGAEIRGSDVWSTGWRHVDGYWLHPGMPAFAVQNDPCQGDTSRCKWLEQVFYDGTPLRHVMSHPASGQFSVDPSRALSLVDTPVGHTVEVTTRMRWMVIRSNGVTIKGFRMRHAANEAQSGAIASDGYSSVTVESNVLSDAHGAVVSLSDGAGLKIVRNDISRGGQEGIHMSTVADSLVQGNRIHDNNTEAFSSGWEAGGMKAATSTTRLTIDRNEVDHNSGPGLWCDGLCRDIIYSNNRVHDNAEEGIKHEISHGAKIFGNAVWQNGTQFNDWGFGAGILVQNSDGCEIYGNTLAWNANGIAVIEQDRTDSGTTHYVFNTYIHDNVVVMQDKHKYASAWLSDYSTRMFDRAQDNHGALNKFGYSGLAESGFIRFAWHLPINSLAGFNATPGGGNSRYLTQVEQNAALTSVAVPLSP